MGEQKLSRRPDPKLTVGKAENQSAHLRSKIKARKLEQKF